MHFKISKSWKTHLHKEFSKPYFKKLEAYLDQQYLNHVCFPPKDQILNAFNSCNFEAVRVVIIGQDPYHDHGQANGLCFSVNGGMKLPPSLKNIFKEIENDFGTPPPLNGNLERWAAQGVLLLNTTLTVRAHEAGSHKNIGWETFTDAVIKTLNEHKEQIVFLLWGSHAKKKEKIINIEKHIIFYSGHPSPLSANRGYWFGNKHFSKTNYLLEQASQNPVKW